MAHQTTEDLNFSSDEERAGQAEFTDVHLAKQAVRERLDSEFVWARGLGWMRWDGRRWRRVDQSAPTEAVRQWVADRYADAAQRHAKAAVDRDRMAASLQEELRQWVRWTHRSRVDALVHFAKGMLLRDATDFDAWPDLLNCANGIVSLQTGELLPHDPDRLMTKVTGAAYKPGATHPDWDEALSALPGDVRDWFQVRLGQGVTGHYNPDDECYFLLGTGANGKTTIMSAAQAALADYFLIVSPRALLVDPTAHTTELASFRGARMAHLEELPEERQLTVARLKLLVGTPVLTARYIQQDDMSFEASHTLFISANYRPLVAETDGGSWRRLVQVTFPYSFKACKDDLHHEDDRLGDPGLRDRLRSGVRQREAVLAWLVEGAVKWYAQRERGESSQITKPGRVREDTHEWRRECDLAYNYAESFLRIDPDAHVWFEDLLTEFNDWIEGLHHKKWSAKLFATRFCGHEVMRGNGVVKCRIRRDQHVNLSRPGRSRFFLKAVPDQYTALLGVRFRRDGEEGEWADV